MANPSGNRRRKTEKNLPWPNRTAGDIWPRRDSPHSILRATDCQSVLRGKSCNVRVRAWPTDRGSAAQTTACRPLTTGWASAMLDAS